MRKYRVRIAPAVRFIGLWLPEPEDMMLWQRGKAYSQDLRARVFAAADDGEPVGRIATLLRVSVSYVSKVALVGFQGGGSSYPTIASTRAPSKALPR